MAQALNIEGFHAVTPKRDCPHCTEENIAPKEAFEGIHVNDPCPDCDHRGENWVCLKPECRSVRCSRYVNSHMLNRHRAQNSDHMICFSFADFSFWCYECDSYIEHQLLDHTRAFYLQKFGEDDNQKAVFKKMKDSKYEPVIGEEDEKSDDEEDNNQPAAQAENEEEAKQEEEKKEDEDANAGSGDANATTDQLIQQMANLNVREPGDFTYEDLVSGLKEGRFKKILIMSGAGISVSAGIPDFRSPGTGLYSQLEEYNLPQPEAIFELGFFKEKPEAFYRFAQNFDLSAHNATPTHYFIKMLQDKGLLWRCMTQNIDNLEEKTGMDMAGVVQCHGANRGASCSGCRKVHDKEELQQAIRDQNIMRCKKCQCPVKPDITFFGESLPPEFMMTLMQIQGEVDLCLIMGTALAVSPFNAIPSMLKRDCPRVLFNMNNTDTTGGMDFTEPNSYKLFVPGKCDETIHQLAKDCGWEQDFQDTLPDFHKA